jgi:hypothetical protein
MSRTACLLFALALLAASGCASPAAKKPRAWQGRDLDEPGWSSKAISGGWSYDLEYALPANATVSWDWVSLEGRDLSFRIVYVNNGVEHALAGQQGSAGRGNYTTPIAGGYHFVWDLDGLPGTHLYYKMPEGAVPHDWPPGYGPGCFLLC